MTYLKSFLVQLLRLLTLEWISVNSNPDLVIFFSFFSQKGKKWIKMWWIGGVEFCQLSSKSQPTLVICTQSFITYEQNHSCSKSKIALILETVKKNIIPHPFWIIFIKFENPWTLWVLFTCPWTFAKTTTPTNFSQKCCTISQCARMDLNKRFLPKPMTTTGWKGTP